MNTNLSMTPQYVRSFCCFKQVCKQSTSTSEPSYPVTRSSPRVCNVINPGEASKRAGASASVGPCKWQRVAFVGLSRNAKTKLDMVGCHAHMVNQKITQASWLTKGFKPSNLMGNMTARQLSYVPKVQGTFAGAESSCFHPVDVRKDPPSRSPHSPAGVAGSFRQNGPERTGMFLGQPAENK